MAGDKMRMGDFSASSFKIHPNRLETLHEDFEGGDSMINPLGLSINKR